MTNKLIACCMLFFLLLVTGCRKQDLLTGTSPSDGEYLEFKFNMPPESRISINEDGSGHFTEGDKIDLLYGSEKHFKLTNNGFRWTPIAIADLGMVWGNYSAFYPALDTEYLGSRNHSIMQDQSKIENYRASDLLQAHKMKGSSDSNVLEMNFRHSMHRLVINLEAKDPSMLDNVSVTVKSDVSPGMVDASFNSIYYDENNVDVQEITPYHPSLGKYMAILAASPEKIIGKLRDGWITIKTNGKTVNYSMPASYKSLESGKETIINLSLRDGEEVDPDFAGQTFWVGELAKNNPAYDPAIVKEYPDYIIDSYKYPEGIWVTNKTEDNWTSYCYRWKEGLGWFNCRKEQTDDKKMCWAAATSDMLHWWIENNADNISRYYTMNPKAQKCPSAEFVPGTVSEIWKMYKDAFMDSSGNIPNGLKWFFSGDKSTGSIDYDSEWKDYKGIFNEVFGGVPPITVDARTVNKFTFNEAIKKALKNGDAIGFVVNMNTPIEGDGDAPTGNSLHSMTIWGAEFDDKGYVSAIYQTDNETVGQNITESFKKAYITRRIVTYSENDEYVYSKGNDITKYREQINAVAALGLGTDKWNEYFNNNK